jgi:hypothetical protein
MIYERLLLLWRKQLLFDGPFAPTLPSISTMSSGRCRDLVCFVSNGRAGGEMYIVADESRRDRQRGEETGKRELKGWRTA